jgi:tetratricopeptide (TPR) repeat protein
VETLSLRAAKLQRDLRLLQLEHAEQPNDPFTLFNLGSIYLELKRHTEALPVLRGSLERSHSSDSIVRKIYALIVQAQRQLGDTKAALAACREGRNYYPEDAELLFQQAMLLHQEKDHEGAIASYLQLLEGTERAHFASIDSGIRGYLARHNLAVIYLQRGRTAEAEAQWVAALKENPNFGPAWLGIAELCLEQGRLPEVSVALHHLENGCEMKNEASRLRLRN